MGRLRTAVFLTLTFPFQRSMLTTGTHMPQHTLGAWPPGFYPVVPVRMCIDLS